MNFLYLKLIQLSIVLEVDSIKQILSQFDLWEKFKEDHGSEFLPDYVMAVL